MTGGSFSSILNSKDGFSLVELMITVGIISIIGLGMASGFVFAATQFSLLQDENDAETSLLQSAYYLRLFIDQALKTQCYAGGTVGAANPQTSPPSPAAVPLPGSVNLNDNSQMSPVGVTDGFIDCRLAGAWTAGQPNALGVFFRENGISSPNPPVTGVYQGVGVYFLPPSVNPNVSGSLIFSQAIGGPTVSPNTGAVSFGHLINVQVQGFTTSQVTVPTGTYNMLQSINYLVTARYFRANGTKDYTATNTTASRDITMQVNVGLHDNFLGVDLTGSQVTGSQTSQRLNGGVYFYKLMAPTFSTF